MCHIKIIRSVILSQWAQQNDSYMIFINVPQHSFKLYIFYWIHTVTVGEQLSWSCLGLTLLNSSILTYQNISGWHSSCDLHDNPDGCHSGSGHVQGE